MRKPKVMFVRVSTKCNSGCFMCRYAHNQGTYNLSKEQFDELLTKMKKEGTYELVRFTGGEPLLHPDIEWFIKRCREEGFKSSIITNGYLMPNKCDALLDAGLNQVIFSLDGSNASIHDKLRNFEGCFNNIMKAIDMIHQKNPNVVIRVNTVASKHNVFDMTNLLNLLKEKGVDMWSIIPIRTSTDVWSDGNEEEYIKAYRDFLIASDETERLKFLGYSKYWGGRNEDEINDLFYRNKFYFPKNKCYLVDIVRFFVPDLNEIVPCNCASHRIKGIEVDLSSESDIDNRTKLMRDWLHENGPKECRGCEPANVYLSENPDVIDSDIFEF